MTQADFRAFSAAHNFKLGFLSVLQGDIDTTVFEKYLTLPAIPDKATELEARLLLNGIIEFAKKMQGKNCI